jgi:hypothetical protein
MYRHECIYRIHVCVSGCVCVCTCGGVWYAHLYNVRLYRRSCIEACTGAQMRTHTRIRGSIRGCLLPIPSCMRVRVDVNVHACVDGPASTGAHRYTCIMCIYMTMSMSLLYIDHVLTCTHACGCVRTRCAHRCRYVCVLGQMPRASMGARVFNRHRFSQICNVHGHPSIFRHVYFGAASRRACGRAVAAGARAGAPV